MKASSLPLSGFLLSAALPFCTIARITAQTPQLLPPPAPYTITFPQDLYDHTTQTEWWYYTGNLDGLNGKPYGFELTFFRSYAPTGLPAPAPALVPIIFADLAVSDLEGGKFSFYKSLSPFPSPAAGITEKPWSIHLGDWELTEPNAADGIFHLKAQQDDFGLDLTLLPEEKPVLHGDKGLFTLDGSDGQGDEYFEYYSYPRLLTAGTITSGGKTHAVAGLSWNDHEFFNLGPGQTFPGWDWFSIQLEDGSSMMLYGLRLPNGQYDPASRGTYIAPGGKVTHLEPGDFTLIPGSTWHSNASGADYPITWTILIPSLSVKLAMYTQLPDQEMLATPTGGSPTYWEGASRFVGLKEGKPVRGKGYLEMLGYAKQ